MSHKEKSFSSGDLPENELKDSLSEHSPGHWPTTPMAGELDFRFEPSTDSMLNAQLGNFKILSLLGEGGFGKVYKAHDMALGRDVAIKFLWGRMDEKRHLLFEREAKAIAALSKHPNIVAIHQWGEYHGRSYIVLEYVESNGVRLLEEHPRGLPLSVALRIGHECAEALQEAHRLDILHRDVKPANILIEPANGLAKLTDFGLARLGVSRDFTIEGTISGSPAYMSPEQARAEALDARSDIFSLGVTLYELLSGRRPFEGTTPEDTIDRLRRNDRVALQERRPDLPKAVCDIVERATAFAREARYQTAGEMARQLRIGLQSLERSGVVISEAETLSSLSARGKTGGSLRPSKRAKSAVIAAGALGVLLACVLVWFLGAGFQGPENVPILQAAKVSMDQGDFSGATSAFQEVLQRDPANDLAKYGYGLALAQLGRMDKASEVAASIQATDLRTDAQAAITFLTQPGEARSSLEAAAGPSPSPYLQSLLARLDIVDGDYTQAALRLAGVTPERFPFGCQYAEALESLGQAQYHLNQYGDAKSTFEKLSQTASGEARNVAQAYLAEIASRLDDTRREDIRSRAAEIRKLIDQGETANANTDEWTSRPLTFAMLPAEVKRCRLAVESGLSDLLPWQLGERLATDTSMRMVDRELIRELLAEQELSAMVSSKEGQLRLGRVLGARLLLKCYFAMVGTKEKILVTLDDTETTERIPVPIMDLASPVAMDAVADSLSAAILEKVGEHYPIQGRLYTGPGGPEINVGAAVGVAPAMAFDILIDVDAPAIVGAAAVIQDAPGSATSRVAVTGVETTKLGQTPESGWFVRQQRRDTQ
jgi:tetratricopeptide (TPR) repeat protein